MKHVFLWLLAAALLVMHLDFWNWSTPYPLLFGVLPIGIWWQALFALGCSVMMALFGWLAWPKELESLEELPSKHDGEGH